MMISRFAPTQGSLFAASLLVTLLSFAPQAQAYTCITGSCPAWCDTATYGITQLTPDLPEATAIAEVQRGMEDWSRVACSGLNVSYTGRSTATAGNSGDGVSVVGWVESGWRHDSNAIGVTGPQWRSDNCIIQADMELNGVNYTWITGSGRGSNVNTYSIVLHEGGHYYGLGHSSESSATMYYAYSGGIDMIGGDDQNGICTLYPGGGGSTDCTETGCPAGYECVAGSCERIMGDGSVCSPCSSNSDCGGANDYCLGYPDGSQYCGAECSGDSDCPGSSFRCARISGGGRQCVGFDGSSPSCDGVSSGCDDDSDCGPDERCGAGGECEPRPVDLGALGDACEEGAECNSGVCLGGRCTQSCDWLNVSSCPSGFYCDGDATGSCGTGVCLSGSPGSAVLGAGCGADTECASLMCDRGRCSTPCIPDGATMCPDGLTCQVGAVPGCGGCHSGLGRTGDPCSDNDQCESGLCATRDGTDSGFCTEVCGGVDDCPTGFSCEDAGGIAVCVPPAGIQPGELGFPCESNGECNSGICAVDGDSDVGFCTEQCSDAMPCPSGYACRSAGSTSVCVPLSDIDGGCGCVIPGASASNREGLGWLLMVAPLLIWARRKRRSRG